MSAETNYIETVFEISPLTKIRGEPTYESLLQIKNELKTNAQTVECSAGGGQFGMLGLVLTNAEYALLSNVPFVRPPHPGVFQIQPGTPQIQARAQELTYNRQLAEYKTCKNVEKALKKQLVEAVDKSYIAGLRNRNTNALTVDIPTVLTHLFDQYGTVTSNALQKRATSVSNMTYDPVLMPIDDVFTEIEDLIEFAEAARIPYTQPQIVGLGYNIFHGTGKFKEAITEWNRLVRTNPMHNNWINFKIHFRRAKNALILLRRRLLSTVLISFRKLLMLSPNASLRT